MWYTLTCSLPIHNLQIDPDDRPSFEEISKFLDAIHLPDDQTLPLTPTVSGTLESHSLRGCISEPTIRLTDDPLPIDDDSRSCGSEGESRVIVEEHSSRHHRLLSSLGSSAGSSCGSIIEYSETSGHDLETDDTAVADSTHNNPAAIVATRPAGDTDTDTTSDLSASAGHPSSDSRAGKSKCLYRRTSDLVIHQNASLDTQQQQQQQHRALHKSKSLNAESEPGQSQYRGTLNSSVQTLVPEDEVVRGECAGDSGIDPGDFEVFKFPLTSTSPRPPHKEYIAAAAAELLSDQGDHTPICTSPNLNPKQDTRSYCTPISKATAIGNSHISPVRDRYSFSGTSSASDEMESCVSPNGQCNSPLGQWSTTSSELSYSLPTPSTPWAPPPSPFSSNTPHSLPTSPILCFRHCMQASAIKRQHRKSAEVTSKNVAYPSSCLRKTSSNRPHSCRTSSLFSDEKDGSFDSDDEFKRKLSIKSVHFVDNSDCGSVDSGTKLYSDGDLEFDHHERLSSNKNVFSLQQRPRSKSNPQNRTIAHFDGDQVLPGGEYSIRLKQDWIDATADPHSCKCYKIGQHSNTRLSSSTPDLSKLFSWHPPQHPSH